MSRPSALPVLTGCLFAGLVSPAMADVVHKVIDPFESVSWRASNDNTAGGDAALSTDVPAEIGAVSGKSLEFKPSFSGKGFEFFRGVPLRSMVIPGITKRVSVWVRSNPKYGWVMQFQDGWGRSEVDGRKLEWNITQGASGVWKKVAFDAPADWVQPIAISGVSTHNWESQSVKADALLSLDQLEVETDISDVDPATGLLTTWKAPPAPADPKQTAVKEPVTPLRTASVAATEEHNVFSGVKPVFVLTARNWRAAATAGSVQWKVIDSGGATVKSGSQPIKVDDNLAMALSPETPKYGVYRFDSTIVWADGVRSDSSQSYAVIPVAKPLTDAEKDASPYGLNVLSARQPMVSTFRKAGIVWFRDYGFGYDWMVRARGADNQYAGWPYYPKIMRDYEVNGARVLANFQRSIQPPAPGAPPGPNRAWTKDLIGMLTAFPSLRAFELDNEYDLNGAHAKLEEAIDWKNYGLYHKKFGDLAQLLGDGQFITVENGRAGIWPERLKRMVKSGDFAGIDVVNSHHYAGTDAPELNAINHNMGFAGDEVVMSFYDQLRAVKAAGASDGKPRQHWLTEFGWDTKAGPIVSDAQQAAYLARAYMLLAAAGTSKGFWYWDLDSEKITQFFDGCGLFNYDQTPKLSYAAYAGLTQILTKAEYLGTIEAGENTWGYLFRNDGKLVASLWTLDGKPGPKIDFGSAKVYDSFANPLEKSVVELGLAPVYAVGVSENTLWFQQSAYSLETPYLTAVTAGDTVTAVLRVKNTRSTAISGKVRLQPPPGWTDLSGEANIAVSPGQTSDISLKFRVAADEPLGEKTVQMAIREGAFLHVIPVRAQIQRPIEMTASALTGETGLGETVVRITNRSAQPLNGALTLKLPASWSAPAPEIKVDALKPKETREVRAKVQWAAHWKEGESAAIEYRTTDGRAVRQPLIPSRLTIPAAPPSLVMDGDLRDWPAGAKLPGWVLGSTVGAPNAEVYLAWSSKGIYVAMDVQDSKAVVPDPRSFWVGDVLELFVDTRNKKTPRLYEPGDHQFWLAPQVDRKRVYAGQWKRNNEIADTQYDLPGVQGVAVRKGDGYVLEALIPAAALKGYQPAPGSKLGLNLNLSVKGMRQDREVFWPAPKSEAAEQPGSWGAVTLGN